MDMTNDSCERMPNIPAENIPIYSKRIKKTVDSSAVHWRVLQLHVDNIYLTTVSMFC